MTDTPPAALAQELTRRIRSRGPMTFAEFMHECLYHPAFGYYSRPEARRFADFYTSVDVHPIFGRLLARQLAEMWEQLGRPNDFWVVEAGAGAGRLAAQILDFAARDLSEFYAAVRYVAVETSAARRDAQASALAPHISAGRFRSTGEMPQEIPCGCILSNELLDALPVHRVVMEKGELREVYVGSDGATLREQHGPLSTPEIETFFREQGVKLSEGQHAEAGLAACRWLAGAGKSLGRGFLLTIDYGHDAEDLYSRKRMRGTLLAYSRHTVNEEFLKTPGEQDLTAHVSFTALRNWGRYAGLETTGCVSQAEFLLALGCGNEFSDLYDPEMSEVEKLRARLLLKTLISPQGPDGMGTTFRVLIQHKGIDTPRLTGLQKLGEVLPGRQLQGGQSPADMESANSPRSVFARSSFSNAASALASKRTK
jgi:SAM-dependent MidA family methyltransferase